MLMPPDYARAPRFTLPRAAERASARRVARAAQMRARLRCEHERYCGGADFDYMF